MDETMKKMKKVIIESPYSGDDIEMNLCYLRACMADCFARNEAPYASHGLYTQPGVLRDEDPLERELGITAGFLWRESADMTVVYTDFGISKGMQYGIDDATSKGQTVEFRRLDGIWSEDRRKDCFGRPYKTDLFNTWSSSFFEEFLRFFTSRWGKKIV